MKLYSTHFSSKRRKVTSHPGTPPSAATREVVKVYPELELAVKVTDPRMKEKIRAAGRVHWGFGYSGRHDAANGTFLVAMKAKRRGLFSTTERQLLTYLAILRELRIRAGKINSVTQGFYTHGFRYCFMAIDVDGQVQSSASYDVLAPQGGKTIFNFIVTILESAMDCSPTVTLTKATEQRDKEVNDFSDEIWSKVYVPYHSSPQMESDGGKEILDWPPSLDLED